MVFAEIDRRARRKNALRTKLAVQMATTFSYASLGVALAGPLLDAKPFGVGHLASMAFGLVCLFGAFYYVPEGEIDGSS